MLKTDFGTRYVDLFYKNADEASWILVRNSGLRFRVALMLWRQQNNIKTLLQGQQATLSMEDFREIDAIIGAFMQTASPDLSADLATVRQEVLNRTILTQFGVRVGD